MIVYMCQLNPEVPLKTGLKKRKTERHLWIITY